MVWFREKKSFTNESWIKMLSLDSGSDLEKGLSDQWEVLTRRERRTDMFMFVSPEKFIMLSEWTT